MRKERECECADDLDLFLSLPADCCQLPNNVSEHFDASIPNLLLTSESMSILHIVNMFPFSLIIQFLNSCSVHV